MVLRLRGLNKQEVEMLQRIVQSRSVPQRLAQRAGIIWLASQSYTVPAISRQVGLTEPRVRQWLRRFNDHGLAGLEDAPRSGRPPRHADAARELAVRLARSRPSDLGLPFEQWTLARLRQAIREQGGPDVSMGTIWKWLRREGLAGKPRA
jgi:transposase